MKILLLALLFSSSVNACWIELTPKDKMLKDPIVIVKTENVVYIKKIRGGSTIGFTMTDRFFNVKESPKTILKLIKCKNKN